jgi:hypothetical protein
VRYAPWPAIATVVLVAFAAGQRQLLPSHAGGRVIWQLAGYALGLAAAAAALTTVGPMLWRVAGNVLRRRRRDPDEPPPRVPLPVFTRRTRIAGLLLGIVLVTAPVTAAVLVPRSGAPATHNARDGASRPVPHSPGHTGHAGSNAQRVPSEPTLLAVGAVVVLGAAVSIVTVSRRRRTGAVTAGQSRRETLRELVDRSVERGVSAMAGIDDVRSAIIGCYAAMQGDLERTPLGTSPVRTPAELLAEAAERGLVAVAPASELTALFERARFSSDRMNVTDRELALQALRRLRTAEVAG